MFNKKIFSDILSKINSTYSTMTDFAKKASFDRTYISKYINMKLDNPPTPKILEKIANASNGITSYYELMSVCDYIRTPDLFSDEINPSLVNTFKETFIEYGISSDDVNTIENISKSNIEDKDKKIATILSKYDNSIVEKIFYTLQVNRENLSNEIDFFRPIKQLINFYEKNQFYMCPVYGRISASQPNWAEECIEGRIPIDPELMNIYNPEECFFLRVNGESMNKEIRNGAYALIRKTDFVENGEIAVVLVNGYDATLKKFSKQGDLIILEPMSTDSSFTTQVYNKDTIIKIIGKYIGKMEINK